MTHDIYVTNFGSNTVSVINSASDKVITTIHVGTNPIGVAFNPKNNYVYVTNTNSGSVSVIDSFSNKFVKNISVGPRPYLLAYDPANANMYVVNIKGGQRLYHKQQYQ